MTPTLVGRWRSGLVVLLLLVTASCGGTESTSDVSSSTSSPTPSVTEAPAPEPVVTLPAGEEPPDTPDGECGGQLTMVETNSPIDLTMFDTRMYVCTMIPEGMTQVSFAISDMSDPLNLYVGYPDLSTLEAGGDGFWSSENGGRDDESITIEPADTGFVEPGPYFIEISGGASAEGASVVLTINMS